MKRSKQLLVLMLVGLAVVYAAIAVVQVRQHGSLNKVMQRADRDALWTFLQLESEYLRLCQALTRSELDPQGMTEDALQLRYDIFVSRVDSLKLASEQALIDDVALLNNTRASLSRFVQQGDRMFGPTPDQAATPATLRELLNSLEALKQPIRDLSVDAAKSSALLVDTRTAEVKSQLVTNGALTAFLCLLTFVFAIATLRQNRQRAEAQAQALHSQLELAGAAAQLELMQRDEKLREVLEQQTVIFENIPLGLIFSADGKIQQVNAGFAAIMGAERDALVGASAGFMYESAAAHDAFIAPAL